MIIYSLNNLFAPHPFPAKMAPDIALCEIMKGIRGACFLDPMVGSGTTIAVAKYFGFKALGFDTDPLSVLMTDVWVNPPSKTEWFNQKSLIIKKLKEYWRTISNGEAYPMGSTEEEKAFVDYWFDLPNRKQLALFSSLIAEIKNTLVRKAFSCLLSCTIISKNASVSLAIDISHSRPHKVRQTSPYDVISRFNYAAARIEKSWLIWEQSSNRKGDASVLVSDARAIPISDNSVDLIVTSPPYFNAIDYIRGHRFSLVWLGYHLKNLKALKSKNIGTENGGGYELEGYKYRSLIEPIVSLESLLKRVIGILTRYVKDIDILLKECKRVLQPKGKLVIVIGDSNIRGNLIPTSLIVRRLTKKNKLRFHSQSKRVIPPSKRYMPPPSDNEYSKGITNRIKREYILRFTNLIT